MGFTSVVLVGHDDGGQLALRAAQKVQTSSSSFNVSKPLGLVFLLWKLFRVCACACLELPFQSFLVIWYRDCMEL